MNFDEFREQLRDDLKERLACAFSLKDVKNMIATVLKERPDPAVNNDEEEEMGYITANLVFAP